MNGYANVTPAPATMVEDATIQIITEPSYPLPSLVASASADSTAAGATVSNSTVQYVEMPMPVNQDIIVVIEAMNSTATAAGATSSPTDSTKMLSRSRKLKKNFSLKDAVRDFVQNYE